MWAHHYRVNVGHLDNKTMIVLKNGLLTDRKACSKRHHAGIINIEGTNSFNARNS
jgi:hypothetical protein